MADIVRVPRIDISKAGSLVGTRPKVNLIEGSGVTLTAADNPGADRVDVTVAASGGGGGGLPLQAAPVSGRYYFSSLVATVDQTTNTEDFADTMIAIPFVASFAATWTEIGVRSPGAGSDADARLGIYASGADGLPDALIQDAGAVTIPGAAGGNGSGAISQSLDANTLYWLVILADSAECPVSGFNNNDLGSGGFNSLWSALMFFGSDTADPLVGYTAYANAVHKAQTYGALPSTFGTPDGYHTGVAPSIWLRT